MMMVIRIVIPWTAKKWTLGVGEVSIVWNGGRSRRADNDVQTCRSTDEHLAAAADRTVRTSLLFIDRILSTAVRWMPSSDASISKAFQFRYHIDTTLTKRNRDVGMISIFLKYCKLATRWLVQPTETYCNFVINWFYTEMDAILGSVHQNM